MTPRIKRFRCPVLNRLTALALELVAMTFVSYPLASAAPRRPEIWLAPFAPYSRPGDTRRGAPDYLELFKQDAPWGSTAAHISVFKIYRDQLLLMPDDALRTIIEGLKERNIALAMESNILIETSVCAPGVDKARPITREVQRLKRLGADLRYLALNEPLVGGHATHGPKDCHASIKAVAADVAAAIKPLLDIYPAMQVGDIEPIGETENFRDWPSQLAEWIDAYREATGRPLAFMHADTVWGRPWRHDLRRLQAITRTAGIPFGVIYTGDFTELSDTAWAEDVARYGNEVETTLGGPPDQVIFQSWVKWPQHSLPDTDLTTMTGMVRAYLRVRTHFVMDGAGHARLLDEQNAPVPNARIFKAEHDAAPGASMVKQRIEGEVPPGAVAALLGLRINAECPCPRADTRLEMTGFRYTERGRGGQLDQSSFAWDLKKWTTQLPPITGAGIADSVPVLNVLARPDQSVVLNGPHFQVVAGARFALNFAWQVDQTPDDAGYVALIFLGEDGIEMRRTLLRMQTTWRTVGTFITDADGVVPANAITSHYPNGHLGMLKFEGDQDHRPSRVKLP